MALAKKKDHRIETRTLRTKLVRNGFDFTETALAYSDCALYFLMAIAEDPTHVDKSYIKGKNGKPAQLGMLEYYEHQLLGDSFGFDIPQLLRRSALKKAAGIYKSWRGNYRNWQVKEEKRIEKLNRIKGGNKRLKPIKATKPPVLPTQIKLNPTYYAGMFKEDTGNSIILKILVKGAWKWVKFDYYSAPAIPGWEKATGSIITKKDGTAWFNWVYERYQPATGGLKTVMTDGNRFVSVDMDLDGEICKMAAYDVDADGVCREIARSTTKGHGKHTARRKSRLGKIALKMSQTGTIAKGFGSTLWDKITRCEREAAQQLSSQLIAFAKKHGCAAIVFEYLDKLKPKRGKYSRRSNQKRAYWLKSAVYQETERKARQNENMLAARVNPRDTSNTEALEAVPVKRTSRMRVAEFWASNPKIWDGLKYHPGSFAVTRDGKIINSGLNACRRIALKFAARYLQKAQIAIAGCVGVVYQLPGKGSSTLASGMCNPLSLVRA